MARWPEWIRWILVLPGAGLATVVVDAFVAITNYWLPDLLIAFAISYGSSVAFVFAAIQIAPRRKTAVGVVLGMLMLVLHGMALLTVWRVPFGLPDRPWVVVASGLLGMLGSCVAMALAMSDPFRDDRSVNGAE